MFRRIVVGYDYAGGGTDALRRGIEMAARGKRELTVAHASDGKRSSAEIEATLSAAIDKTASAVELPKSGALRLRTAAGEGDAADFLIKTADETDAGLIIIGGARRSLSERVIGGIVQPAALGAVASKIITGSLRRPLLIERGGAEQKIRRILAAVNLTPECDELMSMAAALAAEYMAELYVLHVGALPFFPLGSFGAALKKKRAETEERFNAYLERLKPTMRGLEINPILLDGDPVPQAAAVCKGLEIDLAAAGLKPPKGVQESIFGNFASNLAAGAKSSVLLVPLKIESPQKAFQLDLAGRSG